LYKDAQKCHDMDDLNCYLCGCPNFRLTDGTHSLKSFCAIDSKDGGQFVSPQEIHQDCSKCFVPHRVGYIKKHFSKDWLEIMKDV
jgi:Zn-finger protein